MDRVKVKLLFFAKSREIVGKKEADFEFASCTTSVSILEKLIEEYPELSVIAENVVLSLNEEYLELDNQELTLQAGDELAIIPPISGG
ncbi:uncharacterized protein [Littorina saxatilis]|uniref:Molybdopterin synthase sulfur carrier subunit n=1 Tax=Littorina saxatilis TaxID=31220 RepID=A0AAN9C3N2_9CAEN